MHWIKKLALLILISLMASCCTYQNEQEYYEYRIYQIDDAENQETVLQFLRSAYVPAIKRMGLDRIGVFINAEGKDHNIHMLIPFESLTQYSLRSEYLESDGGYRVDSKEFFAIPKDKAPYKRIDSGFFKAFSSIPIMEIPEESRKKKKRLFELRVYESHNDKMAALKRDMFNVDGETQLMRDLNMDPLFFGECLSGSNYPNLTYILTASSMEENKAYWKEFLKSPRWAEMKKIEKYKGTVSKIEKTYLKPVDFSDL